MRLIRRSLIVDRGRVDLSHPAPTAARDLATPRLATDTAKVKFRELSLTPAVSIGPLLLILAHRKIENQKVD